jgi:hypothetical protein
VGVAEESMLDLLAHDVFMAAETVGVDVVAAAAAVVGGGGG